MAAEHAVDEFVLPMEQLNIEQLLDNDRLVDARTLVFANFLGRIAGKTTRDLDLPFVSGSVLYTIDQPNPVGDISFVFRGYTDALNAVVKQQLGSVEVEPTHNEAARFTASALSLESLRRVAVHRSILEQNGQVTHVIDDLLARPLHDPAHTLRDITHNGAHIDKHDLQPFSGLFKRATFVTRIQLNAEEKVVYDTLMHPERVTATPKPTKKHWWNRTDR